MRDPSLRLRLPLGSLPHLDLLSISGVFLSCSERSSRNHVSPYFVAFNSNQLQDTLQGSKMENMVTATQAAKKIGCSEATVSRWATKLGFCTRFGRSRVLTPKQVATISKEWKKSTGNPNFRKKTTT